MGPSPVLGMDAVALMIIDAILVNKVASCAVVSAEVLSNFNTQHRPLRVELSWKRVWQCGYVLHKTAPFVFDLPPVDLNPTLCEDPPWSSHDDIEHCWDLSLIHI